MKRSSTGFVVTLQRLGDLDDSTLDSWRALEDVAEEPNVYVSPDFVLPAVTHLNPEQDVWVACARREDGSPELVGVAVLSTNRRSLRFPLRSVSLYQSPHSYLSGFLCQRDRAPEIFAALVAALARSGPRAQTLVFAKCPHDFSRSSPVGQRLGELGCTGFAAGSAARAVLYPRDCDEAYVERTFTSRTLRADRKLRSAGRLDWRIVTGRDIHASHIETFLAVEHASWKGESGTSLRSSASEERFFREMTSRFAQRARAFFTELRLDGRVVASTSNLISGRAGFAFKVASDPAAAKIQPGLLNELGLIRHVREGLPEIEYLDSGAEPGSYIDSLWLGRRELRGGVLCLGTRARWVESLMVSARGVLPRRTPAPSPQ